MELETLSCNSCGGPLEVPDTVNYVTCAHCSTRLVVKRSSSAAFTEQLDAIEAQQDLVLDKLSRLEKENQLARLDRDWERHKQQYMIADKRGHKHEPTSMSVFGPLVGGVCGIGFMFFAVGSGNGAVIPFGLLFIAVGVVTAMVNRAKHKDFLKARRRYRKQRTAVFRESPSATEWSQLDDVPTPQEYLRRLEQDTT